MLFSLYVTLFVLTVLVISSKPLVKEPENDMKVEEQNLDRFGSYGKLPSWPSQMNKSISIQNDTFFKSPFINEKDLIQSEKNILYKVFGNQYRGSMLEESENNSSTESFLDQNDGVWLTDHGSPNECLDVAVVRIPSNQTRIVGGNFVQINQYPFMAQVIALKKNGHGIFCGGSLISRSHVITAGHCVTLTTGQLTKPKNVKVRLGATYLSYGGELVTVSKINRHPSYQPLSSRKNGAAIYDLAVLKFKKPVKFTTSIAPVALATCDDTAKLVKMAYMNWPCKVLGWGWTKPGIKLESKGEENVLSKQLMLTTVHLVDWTECRSIVPILEKNSELCCASPHATSGCKGDSGGPLVCEDNKEYGLVSRGTGAGCGIPNLPYIYTRVDTLYKFIMQVMKT